MSCVEFPWTEDIKNYPKDEYTFVFHGYKCTLKRMPTLNWNGYIELPPSHPLAGLDYENQAFEHIEVHGGLTYADGEKYGFDTFHCGDVWEDLDSSGVWLAEKLRGGCTFKTFEFVRNQLYELARQFKNSEA